MNPKELRAVAASISKETFKMKDKDIVKTANESVKYLEPEDTKPSVVAALTSAIYDAIVQERDRAKVLVDALESIAAEKCKPSFDEILPRLERGNLISIIDTDTSIARQALQEYQGSEDEQDK